MALPLIVRLSGKRFFICNYSGLPRSGDANGAPENKRTTKGPIQRVRSQRAVEQKYE